MAETSARPGAAIAALALARAARHLAWREWTGTPMHRWVLSRPVPDGLAAQAMDLRPPEPETGRRIQAGAFVLGGETLAVGPRGDPWNRPSPTRRFALSLHRMGWLKDLVAAGGQEEALRLVLEWSRTFGGWNAFSWSPEVLERRIYNLACNARAICARASEAETALVASDLARQARALLESDEGPARAAERAAACAIAGAALAGLAGDKLRDQALEKLVRVLPVTVMADGGHASRSPQAALELLYDLRTLDDALMQHGVLPPDTLSRAIDRLDGAVRFFTLNDGRLACFQGGEETSAPYVAAARRKDDDPDRPMPVGRNGYQRLDAKTLQIMADAHAPASGAWSVTACAQPLALEILAGTRRLITGSGWTPAAQAPPAVRLSDAASTAVLGETSVGEPIGGFPARALGPRLVGAWAKVETRRQETEGRLWLEMINDGWAERFGLRHERRLFVDVAADELRGEDAFVALRPEQGADGRRFIPFVLHFHLAPDVSALAARDGKSVLIKAEGEEAGWQLRSDAAEMRVEPSTHYVGGRSRRTQQIVLAGQARLDAGAKVRWKLSQAGRVDGAGADA
jgi:uncharacterized heparinase superfamily protein